MREYPKQVVCIKRGEWTTVQEGINPIDPNPPTKGRIYTAIDHVIEGDSSFYILDGFEDCYNTESFVDLDIDEIEISEVQEVLEKRETYIS